MLYRPLLQMHVPPSASRVHTIPTSNHGKEHSITQVTPSSPPQPPITSISPSDLRPASPIFQPQLVQVHQIPATSLSESKTHPPAPIQPAVNQIGQPGGFHHSNIHSGQTPSKVHGPQQETPRRPLPPAQQSVPCFDQDHSGQSPRFPPPSSHIVSGAPLPHHPTTHPVPSFQPPIPQPHPPKVHPVPPPQPFLPQRPTLHPPPQLQPPKVHPVPPPQLQPFPPQPPKVHPVPPPPPQLQPFPPQRPKVHPVPPPPPQPQPIQPPKVHPVPPPPPQLQPFPPQPPKVHPVPPPQLQPFPPQPPKVHPVPPPPPQLQPFPPQRPKVHPVPPSPPQLQPFPPQPPKVHPVPPPPPQLQPFPPQPPKVHPVPPPPPQLQPFPPHPPKVHPVPPPPPQLQPFPPQPPKVHPVPPPQLQPFPPQPPKVHPVPPPPPQLQPFPPQPPKVHPVPPPQLQPFPPQPPKPPKVHPVPPPPPQLQPFPPQPPKVHPVPPPQLQPFPPQRPKVHPVPPPQLQPFPPQRPKVHPVPPPPPQPQPIQPPKVHPVPPPQLQPFPPQPPKVHPVPPPPPQLQPFPPQRPKVHPVPPPPPQPQPIQPPKVHPVPPPQLQPFPPQRPKVHPVPPPPPQPQPIQPPKLPKVHPVPPPQLQPFPPQRPKDNFLNSQPYVLISNFSLHHLKPQQCHLLNSSLFLLFLNLLQYSQVHLRPCRYNLLKHINLLSFSLCLPFLNIVPHRRLNLLKYILHLLHFHNSQLSLNLLNSNQPLHQFLNLLNSNQPLHQFLNLYHPTLPRPPSVHQKDQKSIFKEQHILQRPPPSQEPSPPCPPNSFTILEDIGDDIKKDEIPSIIQPFPQISIPQFNSQRLRPPSSSITTSGQSQNPTDHGGSDKSENVAVPPQINIIDNNRIVNQQKDRPQSSHRGDDSTRQTSLQGLEQPREFRGHQRMSHSQKGSPQRRPQFPRGRIAGPSAQLTQGPQPGLPQRPNIQISISSVPQSHPPLPSFEQSTASPASAISKSEIQSLKQGSSLKVRDSREKSTRAPKQPTSCILAGKNFCLMTPEYPSVTVKQVLQQHKEIQEIYKDLQMGAAETYEPSDSTTCRSEVQEVSPGWARTHRSGRWFLVVNTDKFPQNVRLDTCTGLDSNDCLYWTFQHGLPLWNCSGSPQDVSAEFQGHVWIGNNKIVNVIPRVVFFLSSINDVTEMEDQRICIKFCVKNGFKGAENFWMLQTAYGNAVMSRRRVFEWYKRFKEGREETADNERFGRPSTSTTPEKVDMVLELSDVSTCGSAYPSTSSGGPTSHFTAILQHVLDTLDHSISTRTISRRLVANGLHSCRPLRRLPLTPPNRRQRLEWCRARSTWMTEWHRVVFSDESRFCLSSDSRCVRVWRRRGERSNPAAIVERPTVRQRGIMVWGAIAYDSRSPLLRIQGTMTAQRYVDDVLRPVTLPYLQGVSNALYQQDNVRPHTARISQQALQDVQMLP
ncbi:hypothetical protein LAZ67_7003182 [Cordylochernes scorpioides]|uniref:Transposase n=1 Tax=Cordylochernes scorpioides TaxID=51811 RepID=A0ABY6KS97_9ARAC|nr:hypothetical protein LAZ67_7003182 [Cordylochernes scorpioides]